MTQITERKSNFELLRMLSMLMIVIHHYAYHGLTDIHVSTPDATTMGLQLLTIGGNLGVNIFVLIGSYFLVGKQFDWRRPLKIIFDVFLYSYLIMGVYALFGAEYLHGSNLLSFVIPFPDVYWFAGYYVILLLFVPVFNYAIEKISPQTLKYFILFLTVFLIIGPSLNLYFINIEFNRLLIFVYLYFVAAYIKLYMSFTYDSYKFGGNLFFVSILGLVLAIFAANFTGMSLGVDPEVNSLLGLNKVFIVTAALGIFIWFKNMEIPHSKVINTFSGATFGVYLIHEQPLVRNSLWQLFDNTRFTGLAPAFFGGILQGTIVFILCLIVSLVVENTFGRITNALSRICSKWINQFAKSL